MILEQNANMMVKDRVKEFLQQQAENESYIDFCCVGNRGLNMARTGQGDDFLGTVARAMISMRQLNVIFFPQPV